MFHSCSGQSPFGRIDIMRSPSPSPSHSPSTPVPLLLFILLFLFSPSRHSPNTIFLLLLLPFPSFLLHLTLSIFPPPSFFPLPSSSSSLSFFTIIILLISTFHSPFDSLLTSILLHPYLLVITSFFRASSTPTS